MDSRRPAIRRIALYAAAVAIVFGILAVTGNIPSAQEVRDFGDSLGPAAPFLYVPLFVLANFIIAWVILAGAAGLLFGTAAGTPLALAGVTLAALAQMAVSRRLAGEHRGKLLPPRTKRIENFLTENGAVAVMESRIVPVLPYGPRQLQRGAHPPLLQGHGARHGDRRGAQGVRLHRPRRQPRRPHLAGGPHRYRAAGDSWDRWSSVRPPPASREPATA